MNTLLLISCFLLTAGAISEPTCSEEKHMNECGVVNIAEAQCLKIGCCWKSGMTPGESLCYYKNDGYKFFSLTADRIECGHFGITKEDCEIRGCFLSPKFGEPWCFYPNTNIDPSLCSVDRVACGEEGINQDDCEAKGCCWSPLKGDPDGPACFYSMEASTERSSPVKMEILSTPEEETQRVSEPPAIEGFGVHPVEHGAEAMAEAPSVEAFGTHPEVVGTIAEEPGAEGIAIRVVTHGEEGTGTHPPEPPPVVIIVIHGEEEFALIEESITEEVIEVSAESSESAPDQEDLEEYLEDWDLEEMFKEDFEMEQYADDNLNLGIGNEQEKQNDAQRSASCGPDILLEEDCLKLPECYWVPALLPGDQQCLKIPANPFRRDLGKSWKPEAVY